MRIARTRLIAALSLGLFAWSLSAHAQQSAKVPRVAVLSDETPALATKFFEPFAQGLRDLGWVEGQNVTIERRYAEGEMRSCRALPPGWSAFNRRSSSLSAHRRRGQPRPRPRQFLSSLRGSPIRSAQVL